MRFKVNGKWLDSNDEVLVVELTQRELDQINGIPREPSDDRPRRYLSAPDDMIREMLAQYITW